MVNAVSLPKAMDAAFLMATPCPRSLITVLFIILPIGVDQLRHLVSLNQDLKVYTTIDLDLQKLAEENARGA